MSRVGTGSRSARGGARRTALRRHGRRRHSGQADLREDNGGVPLPGPATAGAALPPQRAGCRERALSGQGVDVSIRQGGDRFVGGDFFTCHWMVCSEEPGDKAKLGLEVIVPASYTVIASGTLPVLTSMRQVDFTRSGTRIGRARPSLERVDARHGAHQASYSSSTVRGRA
jgi:hypothetical protein